MLAFRRVLATSRRALRPSRRALSSTDNADAVLLSKSPAGIVTLTLNRPEARNALSVAVLRRLNERLDEIAADPSARVVVVEAQGPVFCSGHDLKEIREHARGAAAGGAPPAADAADAAEAQYEELFTLCSRVMARLPAMPQPIIAKVDGVATAAGCQLVAACDLAYANRETARFATPGVNIGLFCSTPAVALARAVPSRKAAMEMLLTGQFVGCDEAVRAGLLNSAVDGCVALEAKVAEAATQIAARSQLAIRMGKSVFYHQCELPLEDAYALAGSTMVQNMLTHDAEEGVAAFLEKRAPDWRNC